ncbi:MAG: methylmalonyl-CoA mutase family protein, partial [Chloroflexota bacterium]|nr:methylmalonyl-CoA mutase family protein [Chloroflexota bacterium]
VDIPLLRVDTEGEESHIQELNRIRRIRDNHEVAIKLRDLESAAKNATNLMPPLIEAVKSYATLGEMMGVFRQIFGEYQPDWGY